MTKRELIDIELAKVPEERLDEVFGLIRQFTAPVIAKRSEGIMEKLRKVQIEGPVDFAANLDLYMNGEESVGNDIH